LLRTTRHAVRLVEDDQLLPSWWQGDLLLCEALYSVAYDIDAALVGGIEF
jgi:hypothetical protein